MSKNKPRKTINGPINTVRLEGTIDNTKKIIYLFMDIHELIQFQTQCDDLESLDIHQYLTRTFKKLRHSKKKYDFLMEDFDTGATREFHKQKSKYIQQAKSLFAKEFNYEKNNKHIVARSKKYPTVRFHYLDIRNYSYLNIGSDSDFLFSVFDNVKNDFTILARDIEKIKNQLNYIIKETQMLIDIVSESPNINKTIKELEKIKKEKPTVDAIKKLIHLTRKILHKYNNKDIKKTLNIYIKNIIIPGFKENKKTAEKILLILEKNTDVIMQKFGTLKKIDNSYLYTNDNVKFRKILTELTNTMANFINNFTIISHQFTDIYMLRRLLDKKYISNIIAYTGAGHSMFYIHNLVKDFGFKITHVSYSSEENIETLNRKITQNKDTSYEFTAGLFYPKELFQCSDITDFPPNFS